jgi:signal transduction histidine kinase/ligand-binding sensor domain-containing protein/CheY-like chemotaxis protein
VFGWNNAVRRTLGITLFLLITLGFGLTAEALDPTKHLSEYARRAWGPAEGLPQNTVHAIQQTRDGYLWFGTEEGVARFDGVQFTTFSKLNTPAFKSNNVTALRAGRDGSLWIGTDGGGVIQYKNSVFRNYSVSDGLSSNSALAILEDRLGTIWVLTSQGLDHVAEGKVTTYGKDSKIFGTTIGALAADPSGRVFVGTPNGIASYSGGVFSSLALTHEKLSIHSLLYDSHGELWIGTGNEGVYRWNGKYLVQFTRAQGLPHAPVDALYEDRRGRHWLGTFGGGVCRLEGKAFECLTSKQGLQSDNVHALYEDLEGSMWVGLLTHGVEQLRDGKVVTYGPSMGLDIPAVMGIYQGRDESLWLATVEGLRQLKNGKIISHQNPQGPGANNTFTIAGDLQGNIWVGAREFGVNKLENGRFIHYNEKNGVPPGNVYKLFCDRSGNIWIGTEGGLVRYRHGQFHAYTEADGLPSRIIDSIFEDSQDRLWIATAAGLGYFQTGQFHRVELPRSFEEKKPTIIRIYEDSAHVLWMGTWGTGLIRYEQGKITLYSVNDGMFDDAVYAIEEDSSGYLWLSSNRGIVRMPYDGMTLFARGQRSSVTYEFFGDSVGMTNSECDGGAQSVLKTTDGKLLFGCEGGVVSIDPMHIPKNGVPPPVALERVQVNETNIGEAAHVHVGRGKLEFQFAALSFVAPEKVQLKYKLEGFDPDWVLAGNRRIAYYTNIPPGSYTFRVMGANNDGVWNQQSSEFHFNLEPHLYQTSWFFLFCFMATAGLAGGAYRLRIRQLKHREAELVVAVSERTKDLETRTIQLQQKSDELQVAKDIAEAATRAKADFLASMSHEIRTPMNGVLGVTELMFSTELTDDQRDYMGMIKSSGDALLVIINDILDFSKIEAGKLILDPSRFDVYETVGDALKSIAIAAHKKGLELTSNIALDVPRELVGDFGRLRQVILNLASNAIKFTAHGEVIVSAHMEKRLGETALLHFSVRDTGIGVPQEKLKKVFQAFEQADVSTTKRYGGTGLGLAICTRIVQMMGGTIWVESQVGEGSTFHFTAQFAVVSDQESPATTQAVDNEALRGIRALIVDDNFTNLQVLEQMLTNWGILTTTANSAAQAISHLRQNTPGNPFHLILVDEQMPDVDGFGLIEQIRKNFQLPSAIMMLSSSDQSSSSIRCRELSVGYVVKPAKPDELRAALGRVLSSTESQKREVRLEIRQQDIALKVLLAEDNVINQKLALRMLEKLGHSVVLASDGRQAIEQWEQSSFDVIFMDVQMPEVDGLDATREIRKQEGQKGGHVPIIAMTAHATTGYQEFCLQSGMDGYIPKPVNINALVSAIEQLLQLHQGQSGTPRHIADSDCAQSPVQPVL